MDSSISERDARGEHLLYERRRGDEILQLEVEDPLQSLDGERPEGGQPVQDAREVLRLLLGLGVVRHVVLQGVDHLVLEVFHALRVGQAVAFWK